MRLKISHFLLHCFRVKFPSISNLRFTRYSQTPHTSIKSASYKEKNDFKEVISSKLILLPARLTLAVSPQIFPVVSNWAWLGMHYISIYITRHSGFTFPRNILLPYIMCLYQCTSKSMMVYDMREKWIYVLYL